MAASGVPLPPTTTYPAHVRYIHMYGIYVLYATALLLSEKRRIKFGAHVVHQNGTPGWAKYQCFESMLNYAAMHSLQPNSTSKHYVKRKY